MEETIPEIIVDRAVELWKRMLRNPKYNNMGDTGIAKEREQEGMASVMASMLPNNSTDEVLEAFAVALKTRLMAKASTRYIGLHVDYGPGVLLAEAAKEAGLKTKFPWKTNMSLAPDKVSVSHGYGAEWLQHYALPDGRWLITTLSGSDIEKVLEYISGGQPSFNIEEPAHSEVSI